MDIIATWIYLDQEGGESNYPQVRGKSSSFEFQNVYWRCVVVFFESSLRFHQGKRHMLFTNSQFLPEIDGLDLETYFQKKQIELVQIENIYQVPKGYYGSWNNQFYEFSILKFLAENLERNYHFLLLDSDCVFTRSVDPLFRELESSPFPAFAYGLEYGEEHEINGLTRKGMKAVFSELEVETEGLPLYCGGEIFLAKGAFIQDLCAEFEELWEDLLIRHQQGRPKFNEEAHVLSFYYYKFNA